MKYVIDGTNVCWWGGSCSLDKVLAIAIELIKKGNDFYCIFDASTPYRLEDECEKKILNELVSNYKEYFMIVTGSTKADYPILTYADKYNLNIVSNDKYKEYADEFPWLNTTHSDRLVKGNLLGGELITIKGLGYGCFGIEKSSEMLLIELDKVIADKQNPINALLDKICRMDKKYEDIHKQNSELKNMLQEQNKRIEKLESSINTLRIRNRDHDTGSAVGNQRHDKYESVKDSSIESKSSDYNTEQHEQTLIRKVDKEIAKFMEPYWDYSSKAIPFEGTSWDAAIKKLNTFFMRHILCTNCYHKDYSFQKNSTCIGCGKKVWTNCPQEIWAIVERYSPKNSNKVKVNVGS